MDIIGFSPNKKADFCNPRMFNQFSTVCILSLWTIPVDHVTVLWMNIFAVGTCIAVVCLHTLPEVLLFILTFPRAGVIAPAGTACVNVLFYSLDRWISHLLIQTIMQRLYCSGPNIVTAICILYLLLSCLVCLFCLCFMLMAWKMPWALKYQYYSYLHYD